jgi:UDP-N-acetylmuramoyl-tripeptide--D-alanyl-D-alanine ligase
MLDLTNGATSQAIASVCGGNVLFAGNKPIFKAVIDSREVAEGDLFVAIKGERTDGHLYMKSAAEKGAAAVLTELVPDDLTPFTKSSCSVILVKNTSFALADIARAHRLEMTALTVGVTGSVGKTTTRQYVASVLSTKLPTHKTEGNFNNELGLPLTVIGMRDYHRAAVIEMGMGKAGDISFLSTITSPNIAIITTIGTSHIEHLGSREAIRDAKLEVRDGLTDGGLLILNGDEPLLTDIKGAVYVSLDNDRSSYRAINVRQGVDGMTFNAVCPNRVITDCYIPTLGRHTVLDAMYAVAVGDVVGLSENEIRSGLSAFKGVGMRQNIVKRNGITYIHDYYNASPESIRASLSVTRELANASGGRAVAVLGSVLELGELSEMLHRRIGTSVTENKADLLFTFGEDASFIADEAKRLGMSADSIRVFRDITDPKPIAEAVRSTLSENDCVLIKASHGIEMGRIAELL